MSNAASARYSSLGVGERGQDIYESRLRTLLETEENIGRIVSIDVESGDYEIADDLVAAGRRLQQRRPDARMYGKRIGYNAVYAVGGSLNRTTLCRKARFTAQQLFGRTRS